MIDDNVDLERYVQGVFRNQREESPLNFIKSVEGSGGEVYKMHHLHMLQEDDKGKCFHVQQYGVEEDLFMNRQTFSVNMIFHTKRKVNRHYCLIRDTHNLPNALNMSDHNRYM